MLFSTPLVARLLVLAALTASFLLACGGAPEPPLDAPGLRGEITVFAAASLTDAFREIAGEFERANPGVSVRFSFAGSPTLRTQLEQGARADVFASADQNQMELALKSGAVLSPVSLFASNSLVIITPKANPGGIRAPVDLKKRGLKIVLAAPEVPAGRYARQALTLMSLDPAVGADFRAAVLRNVVSFESNVKQVVAKVELGEADAGVVYGTDVTASVASHVSRIEIPGRFQVVAEYPIAVTKEAANRRVAEAFIDFVLSPAGQAVLAKYGFLVA